MCMLHIFLHSIKQLNPYNLCYFVSSTNAYLHIVCKGESHKTQKESQNWIGWNECHQFYYFLSCIKNTNHLHMGCIRLDALWMNNACMHIFSSFYVMFRKWKWDSKCKRTVYGIQIQLCIFKMNTLDCCVFEQQFNLIMSLSSHFFIIFSETVCDSICFSNLKNKLVLFFPCSMITFATLLSFFFSIFCWPVFKKK